MERKMMKMKNNSSVKIEEVGPFKGFTDPSISEEDEKITINPIVYGEVLKYGDYQIYGITSEKQTNEQSH